MPHWPFLTASNFQSDVAHVQDFILHMGEWMNSRTDGCLGRCVLVSAWKDCWNHRMVK